MRSDLFPSVVHGGWDVVTILEEMESEGLVIEHLVTHEDERVFKVVVFLVIN